MVYGSESDWVRNVCAAGSARPTIEGEDVELTCPRLVDGQQAWAILPGAVKRPPSFLRIDEHLRMDVAAG